MNFEFTVKLGTGLISEKLLAILLAIHNSWTTTSSKYTDSNLIKNKLLTDGGIELKHNQKYQSLIKGNEPKDDGIFSMSFTAENIIQDLTFDYWPFEKRIDFYTIHSNFSSLYEYDMNTDLDKLNLFDKFLACSKAIVKISNPRYAIGESESNWIYRPENDLCGLPSIGRLNFLSKEIISQLTEARENAKLFQEALDEAIYHEEMCNGGQFVHLCNEDDAYGSLLYWLVEKYRYEQHTPSPDKPLRPRPEKNRGSGIGA